MDKEDTKNLMAIMGLPVVILLLILINIPTALLTAWAIQKMYIWFLIPLGLPALKLVTIWAMILIFNRLTFTYDGEKSTAKKVIAGMFASVFITFVMLGMGLVLRALL